MNSSVRYEICLNGTRVCVCVTFDTQQQAEREAAIIRRRVSKHNNVQVFRVHSVLCDGNDEL